MKKELFIISRSRSQQENSIILTEPVRAAQGTSQALPGRLELLRVSPASAAMAGRPSVPVSPSVSSRT